MPNDSVEALALISLILTGDVEAVEKYIENLTDSQCRSLLTEMGCGMVAGVNSIQGSLMLGAVGTDRMEMYQHMQRLLLED